MSKFVLINMNLKGPIKTDLSFISGSTIRGAYIHKYIIKNKISVNTIGTATFIYSRETKINRSDKTN